MMFATGSRCTPKLLHFVGLSALVHALIVVAVTVPLPQRTVEPPPLIARLQPAEAPPDVRPQRRQKPLRAAPPDSAVPVVAAATPLPVELPIASPTSEAVEMPATAAAEPEWGAPAPPMPESTPTEGPPTLPATVEETISTPAAVQRLPRKGEITYVLYYNRLNIGRTVQSWEIDNDNYRLLSISETSGLAALFRRDRLAYESRGKLTMHGLQPEYFAVQRLRSGKHEQAAVDFDWNSMTASIGNPQRSIALPRHAQDIVSFMYQLGLTPLVPGRIELPITTGWKLEHYKLDIGSEEQLQTPFGTLRALPVKEVRRPGQERRELWLAIEYRFLPVRIVFYDRRGELSGEQLVSDIRVSTD